MVTLNLLVKYAGNLKFNFALYLPTYNYLYSKTQKNRQNIGQKNTDKYSSKAQKKRQPLWKYSYLPSEHCWIP
jgi:hypothetical protein